MKTNKVMCPKCNTKNLRMLNPDEIIGHTCPVKCDVCNLVFGWFELNTYWNIDAGDFYDVVDETIAYIPEPEWEDFRDYIKSQFVLTTFDINDAMDALMIDYGYPVGAVGSS